MVTSLIKIGARPELNGGYDIITECIRPYQFMLPVAEITSGSLVDNVTILLKHGAKLNDVQRTESGVMLTSHSMRLLLSMNILPLTWSSEYVRLVILPLVHGAVVDSTCIMPLLLTLAFEALLTRGVCTITPCTVCILRDDRLRLMRYLHSSGFTGNSPHLDEYEECQRENIPIQEENLLRMHALLEMRTYVRSLEPRPESLQFQCRRVIRKQMSIAADGKSILHGIDYLQIPVILRDYLKLKDAD